MTLPDYLGPFQIRQLPEAFKPTSPGGFMNPPGVYDKDPTGFFFIPTYNPESKNFYIRAAIEDPRPILGHEGIPGHFLQLSIANHLSDEIRRQHGDSVFSKAGRFTAKRCSCGLVSILTTRRLRDKFCACHAIALLALELT